MRILMSAAVALATFALAGPAQSQDWPQRQVTIVVPFSAGGTTDMFARILSQGLRRNTERRSSSTTAPAPAAISAPPWSPAPPRTATRCSSAR